MEFGSIHSLLDTLQTREKERLDKQLVSAQQEAEMIFQRILREGEEKRQVRKKKAFHVLKEKKEQQFTKITMNQQMEIDKYKQSLIEAELTKAEVYFSHLPESDYLAFLEKTLLTYREKGEVPQIFIPASHFACVKEKYGKHYPIQVDPQLTAGFRLEYQNFDINLDIPKFFQFHKQNFTRVMMRYLFEDQQENERS